MAPKCMTPFYAPFNGSTCSHGTRDPSVLCVLEQADIDCGFSSVISQITYPPTGKIVIPGDPENDNYKRQALPPGYNSSICDFNNGTTTPAEVAFIINSTSLADGCYGNCATFEAAYTYFADFPGRCFNPYNIDTDCTNPLYASDEAFTAYLNDPAVQAAIHAPANFNYVQCNDTLQFELTAHDQRSVPPAYFIIPSLLASDVKVNLWSGTLDYILNPIGTELSIQNMTWNGAQGFCDKPDRKWFDSQHGYAGTWGAERGLGFYLFHGAGHRTSQDKPAAAFTMIRDRVVGDRELPWY
jgi:carboxypeptidase D